MFTAIKVADAYARIGRFKVKERIYSGNENYSFYPGKALCSSLSNRAAFNAVGLYAVGPD